MELTQGKILKDIIGGRPLPLAQVLDIAIQIADTLCAAHEKDVFNKNLKSENIVVTNRGGVKILDCTAEIGKAIPNSSNGARLEANIRTELNRRTDVYSLGIILYEMATGHPPFACSGVGVDTSNSAAPHMQSAGRDVPKALEQLILKCLQTNCDFGYSSAQELLGDLCILQLEYPPTEKIDPARVRPLNSGTIPAMRLEAAPRLTSTVPSGPPSDDASGEKKEPLLLPQLRFLLGVTLYTPVALLRGAVRTALAAFVLSCLTIFSLPFLDYKPGKAFLKIIELAHQLVDPVHRALLHFLSRYLDWSKIDFLLLGMVVASFIVAQFVDVPLQQLEDLANRLRRRKKAIPPPPLPGPSQGVRPYRLRRRR
ncbi:MAG: protein kinase [Acidobacteria bacterium]|nr:protein kinase [Acidobacteriota bacterium]